MAAVNRQLDRGNPVALGYALSDIMSDQQPASGSPIPVEEDHASVFSARKQEYGRCYYYLRNSYGYESKGYKPKIRNRYENGSLVATFLVLLATQPGDLVSIPVSTITQKLSSN